MLNPRLARSTSSSPASLPPLRHSPNPAARKDKPVQGEDVWLRAQAHGLSGRQKTVGKIIKRIVTIDAQLTMDGIDNADFTNRHVTRQTSRGIDHSNRPARL